MNNIGNLSGGESGTFDHGQNFLNFALRFETATPKQGGALYQTTLTSRQRLATE